LCFEDFMDFWIGFAVLLVKLAFILVALLLCAGYVVLVERKLLGRFQVRYGPNRAGPYGLLQPIADIVKMLTKEDIVPAEAHRSTFLIAPAVAAVTALLIFAVIPMGRPAVIGGRGIPLIVSDLNVGLLFAVALTSLGVYGTALGGWSSGSKYGLLGGVRGTAQLISYELSMGLSLVPVVMLANSFSLVEIVNAQARYPFALVQPIAFVIFFISAAAEIKRIPFDLPEGESELVAGYHTEYSGMRFGLFFLGEYVTMIVLGGLVATFFWGGWRGPFLPPIVWFTLKVAIVIFVMIWMRGTLPRLRYDQLMNLGWIVLMPLALLNIVATGGLILLLR
jgi:NADH-quinone oxidoreductase subunit H